MTKPTLLLVEDNEDDVELALLAFERAHFINTVVVAHDGPEALAYLFGTGKYAGRDVRERPQLILLDLKLPKMHGLQVLERIRSDPRTSLIPVVILTSSKEQEDLLNSYREGANSYVRKPVNFTDFLMAAQQLGLYWLAINELPEEWD